MDMKANDVTQENGGRNFENMEGIFPCFLHIIQRG